MADVERIPLERFAAMAMRRPVQDDHARRAPDDSRIEEVQELAAARVHLFSQGAV